MECPECGTPASAEDLFCAECGAVLASSLPDPTAAPPTLDLPLEPLPPPPPSSRPAYALASRDSRANIAFILGIVSIGSLLVSCLPFFGLVGCVGPIIGIAAVVLGAVVKRDIEVRGGLEADRKRAHQGMILGIAGTVFYFVFVVLGLVLGIGASFLNSF
jgi:hypothetical protein